jgi:hypothetical protein
MKFTQRLRGSALAATVLQPWPVLSIQICSPVAESDRPRPFAQRTLVHIAFGGSTCISITTLIEELPILDRSVAKHRELA